MLLALSGTIDEFNSELEGNPEYVNQDPYGKGWMVKMTMNNPAEVSELLDAAAYEQLVGA